MLTRSKSSALSEIQAIPSIRIEGINIPSDKHYIDNMIEQDECEKFIRILSARFSYLEELKNVEIITESQVIEYSSILSIRIFYKNKLDNIHIKKLKDKMKREKIINELKEKYLIDGFCDCPVEFQNKDYHGTLCLICGNEW